MPILPKIKKSSGRNELKNQARRQVVLSKADSYAPGSLTLIKPKALGPSTAQGDKAYGAIVVSP